MSIDHVIFEACVHADAQVVRMRKRRPESVDAVHRVSMAIRNLSRDDAPVAMRAEAGAHPHSRSLLRHFDGRLWVPMLCKMPERVIAPVELSVLKLMLGGHIQHLGNLICLPQSPVIPDWFGFKMVVDTGETAAQAIANRLADKVIIVDDVAYQEEPAPVHMVTVGFSNEVHISRQISRDPDSLRERVSLSFPLSASALARRAEGELAERFALMPGYAFRADGWPLEILIPEAFKSNEADQVWSDAMGMLRAIGGDSVIWRLSDQHLDAWIRVRQAAEAKGRSVTDVLARLQDFTDRLIDDRQQRPFAGYDGLVKRASLAVVTLGTRLALAEFLSDEARDDAFRRSDAYQFSPRAAA